MKQQYLDVPDWDECWNEESVRLAYEAASGTRNALTEWSDALDTKFLGVFAVGGVILTLAPTLQPPSAEGLVIACWAGAAILWGVAVYLGYQGYAPTVLRVGPNPKIFLEPVWLKKSPRDFYLGQLAALADTFRRNHATLERKAEALSAALIVTTAEVMLIAAALILSRFLAR